MGIIHLVTAETARLEFLLQDCRRCGIPHIADLYVSQAVENRSLSGDRTLFSSTHWVLWQEPQSVSLVPW